MSSAEGHLCPICFEPADDHWSSHKVWYHNEANHSWNNQTCDGHGVCWGCLAKYIEVQALSEGKSSIKCPDPQCHYRLLQKDVEYAMWGSSARDEVLETLSRVRNQFCEDRLKEMVCGTLSRESATSWLLGECQPCPECFVLCRRETGCNHIVCRCGCDFCFSCGAPSYDMCLCGNLVRDSMQGTVFFAAWLRTSYQSPCEWLWEEVPVDTEDGPSSFIPTLGFWLWIAGADIPVSWTSDSTPSIGNKTGLPPLQWTAGSHREDLFHFDELFFFFDDGFDSDYDVDDVEDMADVAGHLRREVYSHQTQRSLRRGTQRKVQKKKGADSPGEDKSCLGFPKANRTLY